MAARVLPSPLVPALVTGFGFGAFLDGILLHQVLQWHHLVSSKETTETLDGLETNTFWDGLFHLGAWVVAFAGAMWLWASWRRQRPAPPLTALGGALLVGWGAFNVVDQLVFHLALGAHHIREGEHEQLYDWGYTAIGVLLIVLGLRLARDSGRSWTR